MKLYRIQGGVPSLVQESPRALGPRDVRVAMRAWSLNYRDLMVVRGTYGRTPDGLIPLSDGAGEVVEVGPEVTGVKAGDRVASLFFANWEDGPLTPAAAASARGGAIDGVLVEESVAPESSWIRIPDGLAFEDAACLPCAALTAWHSLFDFAQVQPGETVLLQGTGGVSLFGLAFAKLAGARTIVTSRSEEKAARAKGLGADETIVDPDWEKRVFALGGADVVLEVGGAGTLAKSLRASRFGGRIAVIGVLGGAAAELSLGHVFSRHLTLRGIYVGSRAQFGRMLAAIERVPGGGWVDSVFSFEEFPAALAYLESGRHFGKVVISRRA